ncbi:RecG-like helicases [gamma proteobacterium HdN1]|nr:RecG-like helicases [gamma proteobacterium HdN1]
MTLAVHADSALRSPVQYLKGVGPTLAVLLTRLHIHTVQDLLFHLPFRYQDRTQLTPIATLEGSQEALIQGEVLSCDIHMGRRRTLAVRITDGSGTLLIRMFHFSATQQKQFAKGQWLRCYGEARVTASGREMVHPEYRLIDDPEQPLTESLTPIYPLTEGISQARLLKLTEEALTRLDAHREALELVPEALFQARKLPSLADALHYVHRPPTDANVYQLLNGSHPAQQRLALEEMLAHHLSLRKLRATIRHHPAPPMPASRELIRGLLQRLPFAPTGAQNRVFAEIEADLQQPAPMLRLVQGDVGSGKTLVAALAALQAIEAGYQVALMAPTEILAEQHYQNFCEWFEPLGLHTHWLTGKLSARQKRLVLEDTRTGHTHLLAGTHALFQDDVHYARLGLVIIDEQHRFGVHQRLALKQKGAVNGILPHQLIMTATPIPRTLAMSAYADLDTSIIDELPPGRTPITTVAVDASRRDEIIQRVYQNCKTGRQAYWVCTLIEESETLQCQAAEDTTEYLRAALPDLQIGLIHGRMKAREKSQVMEAFQQNAIQLLVATTVIEVGVNVPNASLMIIENPERLGLAQLHQLRGRVGRGAAQSFCVLLYQKPLSRAGRERIEIMRESHDGFVIAQRDLELRGPGEVLGTRQTGDLNFKVADLLRDQDLLDDCKALADHVLSHHPDCVDTIIQRWLAQGLEYGSV